MFNALPQDTERNYICRNDRVKVSTQLIQFSRTIDVMITIYSTNAETQEVFFIFKSILSINTKRRMEILIFE